MLIRRKMRTRLGTESGIHVAGPVVDVVVKTVDQAPKQEADCNPEKQSGRAQEELGFCKRIVERGNQGADGSGLEPEEGCGNQKR